MINYNNIDKTKLNTPNLNNTYDKFLNSLKKENIELHSFALIKDDQLLLEKYTTFQNKDTLHRMYSVTKSVVSIAIGLLVTQNKIKLTDKICDYFQDKIDESTSPLIFDMNVEDLLTMRTCYNKTTYKIDLTKEWVKSFFISEADHKSGTIFNYDSSASHTLCALVERLTNKKLIDFINESLAPYFSFSKESYIMEDPFGVSIGASGLMTTTIDLINFSLFLKNNCYNLIDSEYFNKAISKVVETKEKVKHEFEIYGYGYQFWHSKHDGYFCYGMDGQLIISIPKMNFIAITTANTKNIQSLFDNIFKYFLYQDSTL